MGPHVAHHLSIISYNLNTKAAKGTFFKVLGTKMGLFFKILGAKMGAIFIILAVGYSKFPQWTVCITHPDKVEMRCTFLRLWFFSDFIKINLNNNYNSSRRSENEVHFWGCNLFYFLSHEKVTNKYNSSRKVKIRSHFWGCDFFYIWSEINITDNYK